MDNITKFIRQVKKDFVISRHYRDFRKYGCRVKFVLGDFQDVTQLICLAKATFGEQLIRIHYRERWRELAFNFKE